MTRYEFLVMVELKMLPGEASATGKFLQSKLKPQITIRGEQLVVDYEKADGSSCFSRSFYIKIDWKVTAFSARKGLLNVVPDEQEKTRHEAP